MTPPLVNPDSLSPAKQKRYVEQILNEVDEEVKAGKIEREWYPLNWEERHKF